MASLGICCRSWFNEQALDWIRGQRPAEASLTATRCLPGVPGQARPAGSAKAVSSDPGSSGGGSSCPLCPDLHPPALLACSPEELPALRLLTQEPRNYWRSAQARVRSRRPSQPSELLGPSRPHGKTLSRHSPDAQLRTAFDLLAQINRLFQTTFADEQLAVSPN